MAEDEASSVPNASDETVSTGPSASVRLELQQLLMEDTSLLGEVYRYTVTGLSAKEIAERTDSNYSNYVYNYRRQIESLLDAQLPSAPSLALQAARKVSAFLKWKTLSPDARRYLEDIHAKLESLASIEASIAAENEQAQKQTAVAESRDVEGIYVYALPHYLRYPSDPATGRTLMKVGHSASGVITRFRQQVRTASLPEEPVLLRIYRSTGMDSASVERDFHALLDAADHARSSGKSAGKEWFVTSVKFLDALAKALHLDVEVVADVSGAVD